LPSSLFGYKLHALLLHIPPRIGFIDGKMPNFLKDAAANNFVSGNRLNHSRDMFRGKETPIVTF